MNDLDHMLNGKGSRELHLEIIRLSQQMSFARKAKSVQSNKIISSLRVILVTIINLVMR